MKTKCRQQNHNFTCYVAQASNVISRTDRRTKTKDSDGLSVLCKILESQRDEVTGNWRTLHNEELYDLYSSPNIIWGIKARIIKLVWHVTRTRARIGTYRVLLGKPEEKRALWRTRRKWEDNIKTDFQRMGWGTDWIDWLRIGTGDGVLWMR